MEQKALKSLLKRAGNKDPIYLQVTTDKEVAREKNAAPVMIKLAHRFRKTSELRICLIVKEDVLTARKVLQENDKSPTRDMFSQIVSFSNLKSSMKSRKALIEFRKSVDLVLADHRIINQLPDVLGKAFYKSGKDMPVPVKVTKPYDPNDTIEAKKLARKSIDALFIRHQVKLATKSSPMALTPSTCVSIQVGYSSMDQQELLENIVKVRQDVVERLGTAKVKAKGVHIKTPDSAALPI